MNFQQTKSALGLLGQSMRHWADSDDPLIHQAYIRNNWFTESNIKQALYAWADLLSEVEIEAWIAPYLPLNEQDRQIAIIMAGNMPLVGLHDLICVLITGNRALVKLSSDDEVLMKAVIKKLWEINDDFGQRIVLVDGLLPNSFDLVIATGSNNSNRYFEYYFKNKPHLLRKNRSSVAVIHGDETVEEMTRLADDVFLYFGLGCRNVSHLLLPEGYDFSHFYEPMNSYEEVYNHNKYANNYTYHKSIFLMNNAAHLDNGFLLLQQNENVSSPLSVVHYTVYQSVHDIEVFLNKHADEIQCIVGRDYIPFGQAQFPKLNDYADGVDTINFINHSVFA